MTYSFKKYHEAYIDFRLRQYICAKLEGDEIYAKTFYESAKRNILEMLKHD